MWNRYHQLCFLTLAGCIILLSGSPSLAQPLPKVLPLTPSPQSPTLTNPGNLGGKPGTAFELTLTGTELANPVAVYLSCGGQVTFPTDNKNGTDPAKLRIKVDLPADAAVGLHTLRLATQRGISNIRAFVVDELPHIVEKEDNHTRDTAQPIASPCVVLGRTDAEVSDFFRLKVAAGQQLTFEVLARRAGSPLDPIILLHDGSVRKELLEHYADDTPGLQSDCRLTHTFKTEGEIVLEVRDSTYRGGGDFFYRLRVGDFPGAIASFPLAITRGKPAQIHFAGLGGEGIPPVVITSPTQPLAPALSVRPRKTTGVAGLPVAVRLSDYPELTEQEPNNDTAHANPLPIPGGISARFGTLKDLDYFAIDAKKDQKLLIAAMTFEVNVPTEVFIRILNDKGAELARSNPQLPHARVEFTAPADGKYFIACEHLNYKFGLDEVYHLSVVPAEASVELILPLDRYEARAGQVAYIAVSPITRAKGLQAPIELEIVSGVGLGGSAIVPPTESIAFIPLKVPAQLKPGAYPFRVIAKMKAPPQTINLFASAPDLFRANLAGLPNPPIEILTECGLAVLQDQAFTLSTTTERVTVEKGQGGKLILDLERSPVFDGDVTFTPIFFPPEVTIAVKPIPKGQKRVEMAITLSPTAALGTHPIAMRALGKVGGKDYSIIAPVVTLDITQAKK